MFIAAQILRGIPLSALHFFSPSGAGGAGATLRRVRAAYSRTRCLPHPKGWVSAPTGRFCVALTYCSYHIFCVQRVCPHCGQTWTQFIPHENRTPCFALALGILPKQNRVPSGQKMRREVGYTCPASRRFCLRRRFRFWGENRSPSQSPTKGPTPRFSSRRCTDATRPAGGPHKPSQGLTRGSTFLGCRVQLRWAVIGGGCPEEHLLSTLRFSELFQSVLIFWGISLP